LFIKTLSIKNKDFILKYVNRFSFYFDCSILDMEISPLYFFNANISIEATKNLKRFLMLKNIRKHTVVPFVVSFASFFNKVLFFNYRKTFIKFMNS
jgi:hypothetical protein